MKNRPTVLAFHQGGELYGSDLVFLRACHALSDHFSVAAHLDFDGPLSSELQYCTTATTVTPLAALRKSTIRNPFKFAHLLVKSCVALSIIFYKHRKLSNLCYVNTLVIPLPLILAKIFGYKTISHIHETLPKSLAGRILYTTYSIFSDKIIVVSKTVRDSVLLNTSHRNTSPPKIIYNGIEQTAAEDIVKGDGFRIMFVGRISERKGLHILLDALAGSDFVDRIWTLEVIGGALNPNEPYLNEIKNRLNHPNLNNRVRMLGFRPDARHLLRTAHLFVFPSIDFDSFPTVVLEAMAENVPIIATDTGGASEMIENGVNGILIAPGSVTALRRAIISVLEDPLAALVRSKNAKKQVADRFTSSTFRRKFLSVFKELNDYPTDD